MSAQTDSSVTKGENESPTRPVAPDFGPDPFAMHKIFGPRVQGWGFDNHDPVLEMAGYTVRVQISSASNTFGLDRDRVEVTQDGDVWTARADGLSWAGQQEKTPGFVELRARKIGSNRVEFSLRARGEEPLRVAKLIISGLDASKSGSAMFKGAADIQVGGQTYKYPDYFNGMPAWFIADDDEVATTFYSLDLAQRPKYFVVYPDETGGDGKTVELIFEELATKWRTEIEMPVWVVTRHHSQQAMIDERLAFLEENAGLVRWEERRDIPAWIRKTSLVTTIHNQHWGGFIFNDYQKTLDTVRHVTERIEGERVMVFLAGWEGRYYWQYGDYHADPRMGGDDGFRRMIDGIHATGAKIMLMFGGNCVNATFDNYESFGPQSRLITGNGLIHQGNMPDWDGTRTCDTGWQAWLNPAAPAFQDKLVADVGGMVDRYGVDGVYLDTLPWAFNDRSHDLLPGLRRLVERLREDRPDLLVAFETWFDLTLPFVGFSMVPGGYRNWGSRYARRMAFLGFAEPERGSSGTHEQGYFPYHPAVFRQIYDLPTISFVENTLSDAQAKVDQLIEEARAYRGEPAPRDLI